ncbi:MAG: LicD family protein [Candidatus Faecousia sp.]|nr:LicD family protein [Candidatus Faecousia sp.]
MEQNVLRKVQLTELEIAKEIKRVCEENGIRYFLYRGTFLGAVRHQGFIPWDDDMDIAMLREDYDRFRMIAPEKLGKGFCFQDWHTDPGYAHPFGKVRKRGTLFVEAKCRPLSENGIYVDVYPLDFAPEDSGERKKLAWKLLQLYRMKLMKSGYTPWREETRIVWKKRIGYLLYQAAALLFSQEKLIQAYEDTIRAIAAGDTVYEQSALPIAYYFPKDWCEHLAEYSFEGEAFPGPKDYDGFLGTLYGEYMVLPPVGKRENRHQIMELDFGE